MVSLDLVNLAIVLLNMTKKLGKKYFLIRNVTSFFSHLFVFSDLFWAQFLAMDLGLCNNHFTGVSLVFCVWASVFPI